MGREKQTDCIIWHRKLRDFFKKCSEEIWEEYGIKQIDLDILYYLHHNPEASIGEISRIQSLNKGQLSLTMNSLKEKGLILMTATGYQLLQKLLSFIHLKI